MYGAQLFTTNLILAETHALILARSRRVDKAVEFLTRIHASERTTIVRVTEEDEPQALSILSRYQDKLFSFTDAASFVVMERLGITHALTLDDDFRQYGLMTLPRGRSFDPVIFDRSMNASASTYAGSVLSATHRSSC